MDSWKMFVEAVARSLAAQRIGRPVVLRCHAWFDADHGALQPGMNRLLDTAEKWFGCKPNLVETQGGAERGHLVVLARFAEGQTALLTNTQRLHGEPRWECLFIGTQGSLQFYSDTDGIT